MATLWTALVAALVAAAQSAWSAGAIAVVAGSYVILRWSSPDSESIDRTVRAVWLLPVALGLLFPVAAGLISGSGAILRSLSRIDPQGTWLLLAGAGVLCAGALVLALRWPRRWPDWSFLLVVGLTALVVRVAYVSWIRMDPVSDFQAMWELAGGVVEGDPEARRLWQERLVPRLHFQRILPYLLPLRLLFGPSRWAYVIPNCIMTVGSSLITFQLARRFFGSRAGRVAFVLSLLAIEPVLASGIPTHDIPGAFLTLLAILVFLAANRAALRGAWWCALGLGVGLGLLLTALDLQRNTSRFLVAAFALYIAGVIAVNHARARRSGRDWKRPVGWALLTLVLPLAVNAGAGEGLRLTGVMMDRETESFWQYRALAAHTDSWSIGDHRHARDAYYHRIYLDRIGWRDLAMRKLATDLVRNPEAWLSYVLRKSMLVLDLGSQHAFYLVRARFMDGEPVERPLQDKIAFVNRCFVALFLALLLGGSVSVWRDPLSPAESLMPAIYLALFLGALLLFYQSQPRYAFQIWYLGSIYAGALFRCFPPRCSGAESEPERW